MCDSLLFIARCRTWDLSSLQWLWRGWQRSFCSAYISARDLALVPWPWAVRTGIEFHRASGHLTRGLLSWPLRSWTELNEIENDY